MYALAGKHKLQAAGVDKCTWCFAKGDRKWLPGRKNADTTVCGGSGGG